MYNTRYWFMKKIYPDYLLLFKTSKNKLGYKCFGLDKRILNNINYYPKKIDIIEERLNKLNINYMLIDNLQIIKIQKHETNMYNYCIYKFISLDILVRIRVCVFR